MDIFEFERAVYPLRFIVRVLIIFALAFFLKGILFPEPQAYISLPEARSWVKQVEWQAYEIQRAAQDLPASIEVVLRRLFRDIKPQIEAKTV